MSGTERKSWSEVLPLLFNLLVENADRIVDDTSLERILEWLKNVCETDGELQKLLQCGTIEFISTEQVFSNPESSGFFLRLFGFLVAKAELFRSFSCAQDGDFLSRFLDKPKSEPGLWNEGIVRHGYFQALISLTEHEDGVAWLRIGGHIDCALDCITDRSMFVAKSAQSLIAKYLIRESNWILSSDSEELMSNNAVEANDPRHVIERLRSMLNSQCTASSPAPVAVFEVMRMLLLEDSYHGQQVLQESKLFPHCLELIKACSATVCEKLVDMLCEFAKNMRSWELNWDSLFSTEESSASSVLLGSCVDLFKKGLIVSGLELVSGLAFCQGSSRSFTHNWLEALFDIVKFPFELSLSLLCQENGKLQNGDHSVSEGGALTTGSIVIDGLIADDKQKKLIAKEQLQCILSPKIKECCSITQVVCQALAAAQSLINQASTSHSCYVFLWLKHSVGLIQGCISPNNQSTSQFHSNQKVVKACLGFISSLTEMQNSQVILEHTDSCTVNQTFNDVVVTLVQLIESSESSASVIFSSLKTLGKLLNVTREEFITELFSCQTLSGEIPTKQARLDSSDSWKDVQQEMTVKRVDSEKLALVLSQRLCDSRWEVKDSSLEFVASLLQVNHDSIHQFLCRHSIHLMVWNATDDADSYVRATAVHVIGSLVCQSQLWISLLQNSHLTEESILQQFLSILENDDEAFPRRRAIECLSLWVKARHPIVEKRLQLGKPHQLDSASTLGRNFISPPGMRTNVGLLSAEELSEGIRKSDDSQKLRVVSQSEGTKATTKFEIARSVCHACKDLDWEVKLRGLEFWEAVIDSFISFQGSSREKASVRSKASVEEEIDVENMKDLFQLLFDMGALNILNEVLNDCDVMVCEKALKVLASLQNIANPEGMFNEQSIKTSWEFHESLGKSFDFEKFKDVLLSADFPSLTQSNEAADSSVRSDPVSFIQDIILAASHQDENLLDCY